MTDTSPAPAEADVRLSVTIGAVPLEFCACLTAACVFIQEIGNHADAIMVSALTPGLILPRLPNEGLYLL